MKFITKVVAAAFLLSVLLPVAAFANPNVGVTICEDLDSGKIDTPNPDPETVTVTAPEGFLIDSYCVKAGNGEGAMQVILVDPPQATVVISHPIKDSVSHYSYSLIEIVNENENDPTCDDDPTLEECEEEEEEKPSTTTTIPETTTTVKETPTSTIRADEDVTPLPTIVVADESTTTTTPVADEDRAETLPFTGSENIPFMVGLSLALLALGGYLIRACRPE